MMDVQRHGCILSEARDRAKRADFRRHRGGPYAGAVTAQAALLYDGHCRLCTGGAQRLARWARPGSVELLDFQQPGVLDRFPGLTHAQCMQAMQFVGQDGQVRRGVDAIVATLRTRGWWFGWTRVYRVSGVRFLADRVYAWVARNRYRLMGHAECSNGACGLPPRAAPRAEHADRT
jgi:predicted DCC family thiol-disulfide oxidoreductase YuxK